MSPKETGELIAMLRKQCDMTQKQLAERLDVTDKAISRWETGRGYPDIDALLALSECFGITVNELLCGERIESERTQEPPVNQESQIKVATQYIRTTKRSKTRIIVIIVLSVLLAVALVLGGVQIAHNMVSLMGASNCIISNDYQRIVWNEQTYLPLEISELTSNVDSHSAIEAQVEGKGLSTKLFFGDQVCCVYGCDNNDIIYLQTEYDDLPYHYYCRETRLEHYKHLYEKAEFDDYYAEIPYGDYSLSYSYELTDEFSRYLDSLNKSDSTENYGDGERSIDTVYVEAKAIETPFIRFRGEILRRNGVYYWYDASEETPDEDFSARSSRPIYEIDNSYYTELNSLFEMQSY